MKLRVPRQHNLYVRNSACKRAILHNDAWSCRQFITFTTQFSSTLADCLALQSSETTRDYLLQVESYIPRPVQYLKFELKIIALGVYV
jgi:hypothetical protein